MERLLDLDQITLLPPTKTTLTGAALRSNMSFNVNNPGEQRQELATSLPIFAADIESIVNKRSAGEFLNNGIRPVLPASTQVVERLDMCKWIFCSFTPYEVMNIFVNDSSKFLNQNLGFQYHINIDAGQLGYSNDICTIAKELRRIYGSQVLIMAGSVGCPEGYGAYSRAGVDYMRVGLFSRSTEDRDKYGFYYPMASLLEGIKQYKRTIGVGLSKEVKIVADGGICTPSDIVKAMALGADYVMCGRLFAPALEAAGELYKGKTGRTPVLPEDDLEKLRKSVGLSRKYCKSPYLTSSDSDWRWVEVNQHLKDIVRDVLQCVATAFEISDSKDWKTYKNNIRYASIG